MAKTPPPPEGRRCNTHFLIKYYFSLIFGRKLFTGRKMKTKIVLFAFLLTIPFVLLHNAQADKTKTNPNPANTFQNKDTLSQKIDSAANASLKRYNVPGAVICIVKDGKVIINKGYGYSNLQTKKVINPQKTLFRLASVSKIFTGIAVMQMVEQNKLELNKDINTYLKDFKFSYITGRPVYLRDLLTHTAGFDDRYIGKSAHSETESIPLDKFIPEFRPAFLYPAGEIYTYSNYGIALAAYLVQSAANTQFDKYAGSNIFSPLDMQNTFYCLPQGREKDLVTGYWNDNGTHRPFAFDFLNDYPAGQLLSTSEDISKFILAFLNKGEWNGHRILSEKSVNKMESVQFTHNSALQAACGYIFTIDTLNNQKIIMHDGGYVGTSTRLMMLPEKNTGFFIACSELSSGFTYDITDIILNSLFPVKKDTLKKYPLTSLPPYNKNVDRFTGYYRFTRYSHKGLEKLGILFGIYGSDMLIKKNENGMLIMPDLAGNPRRLIQIKPLLFQSVDDDYRIAFRQDKDGKITHVFTNGISAMEKVHFLYSTIMQRALIIICLIIFVVIAMSGIFGRMFKSFRKKKDSALLSRPGKIFKCAKHISTVYSIYFLLFGLSIMLFIPKTEYMLGFAYGLPWIFYVLQVLPFIGIILTIRLIYLFFIDKHARPVKMKQDIAYSLFIFISVIFIVILKYWNLLGWTF
jgi:CubicO group peptidase (beta-lactamase class C family)